MCDPISRKTTFFKKKELPRGNFILAKTKWIKMKPRSWIETEPAVCLAIDPLGVVLYFDPLPWFMHYITCIIEASRCRLVQSCQCVRECFTQMALLIRSNYLRKQSTHHFYWFKLVLSLFTLRLCRANECWFSGVNTVTVTPSLMSDTSYH